MRNELRQDPLTHRWVIIAKKRAKRPHEIIRKKEGTIKKNFVCPFDKGKEKLTGQEVYRLNRNHDDWLVRSIINKAPYFNPPSEQETGVITRGILFTYRVPIGVAEVFVETPDHYKDLVFMCPEELEAVIEGYKNRYTDLAARYEEVSIFRNHGYLAGQSLMHPHSQITAMNEKSPENEREEKIIIDFYKKYKFCLMGHMEKVERLRKKRLITQNDSFVAICPWASMVPYEIIIIPKTHNPNISYLSAQEITDFALILQDVLRRLYLLLDNPDYNYYIRNYPKENMLKLAGHWYLRIIPHLNLTGGYEASSGSFINSVPPEEAASQLKEIRPEKKKWTVPRPKK